jgi:hypothetical protein
MIAVVLIIARPGLITGKLGGEEGSAPEKVLQPDMIKINQ